MMSVNKVCTASPRGLQSGDQEKCEAYCIKAALTAAPPHTIILFLKRQYEEVKLGKRVDFLWRYSKDTGKIFFKKKIYPNWVEARFKISDPFFISLFT